MQTTIEVKVVADSLTSNGHRLSTLQLNYPRIIHAELMTHRVFSRNASSSRAIPVARQIELARENMQFPIRWGKNKSGMQADSEDLTPGQQLEAEMIWHQTAEVCLESAQRLADLGLHKQWSNRMLEWFGTISVVVTSTDWSNFFAQRAHPDAQPEIEALARKMLEALDHSSPARRGGGRVDFYQGVRKPWNYHLPYVVGDERELLFETALREKDPSLPMKVSAARCARVSYLNHDGSKPDWQKDLELYKRLVGSIPAHASPLEHPAVAADSEKYANFTGWASLRYMQGF